MKLDKIRFAMLVSWIGRRGIELDADDCNELDNLINITVPDVEFTCVEKVDDLLRGMIDGLIPAIKAYRALTNAGLKEAKDAVEKYRNVRMPGDV